MGEAMGIPMWQWTIFGILFSTGALLTVGALPRNRWVGLRTARTLGARGDWYGAHRALGLVTLGLAATGMLPNRFPLHPLFQATAGFFLLIGAAGLYAIVHRRYAA
mgnify:FL=1